MLVILIFTNACEKEVEDLKDPASADKWTLFNTTTGLPGNQVRGIKTDSKNNIWFAVSSHGAAKYSNNAWTYYNTSNSGILGNGITCIEEDRSGNIFFGTTNGLSILSTDNTWSYYRDQNVTLTVLVIKAASDGTLWLGTYGAGFLVYDGSSINQYYSDLFQNVNDIVEDAKGNMWIGTDNGLIKWDGNNFSFFSMTNGLPDNIVTSLLSDSQGRLWIGTYFGKTVSWIDNSGMHQQSLLNGDTACEINDIWEDRKGDIWFATYESGLIKFDGVVPYSYKKYNGFPENDVLAVGEDNDGNIWFGLYSKGLVKYALPID
ncbi:MAG: hypothetical protein NTV31_05990 [Bacteroidia bacterium]|nr:hypothetical protein [Bacteroidia bacterium]